MDSGLATLRKGRKHGVPTPLSDAVAIAAILASLLVVVAGVCIYRRWSRKRSKRAPRFKHRNSDAVPLRTVLDSPGSERRSFRETREDPGLRDHASRIARDLGAIIASRYAEEASPPAAASPRADDAARTSLLYGKDDDIEAGGAARAGGEELTEMVAVAPEEEEEAVVVSNGEASAPAPAPATKAVYTALELRQMEGDGDASHCWQPIPSRNFNVRSATYMQDSKKVPSGQGSRLLAVEFFRAPAPVYDVAGRPGAPTATLGARCPDASLGSTFVVNMVLPAADGVYQLVMYYGILADERSGAAKLLKRFCSGSDAFRNARFKLIPSVEVGSWFVKKAVGSRPAILGKAVKQRFSKGKGYFEVDVDCNSSPAAGRVISVVKSYAKSLVVDLAFLIEAQNGDELPERLLGCARLSHIELDDALIPAYA